MLGEGEKPISKEGVDTGSWVLMDFNDVICHVFSSSVREHYDLEGLWVDAARIVPEEAKKTAAKKTQAAQ